jgi:hypothetical protein
VVVAVVLVAQTEHQPMMAALAVANLMTNLT